MTDALQYRVRALTHTAESASPSADALRVFASWAATVEGAAVLPDGTTEPRQA
ncbi:hypothetical protein SAMN05661080_01105 [Modestobacter sp. DSM 44400]|nr:hypothetical protein SAMN05661080_01105 [Modestobacter sp. DSM 44400]